MKHTERGERERHLGHYTGSQPARPGQTLPGRSEFCARGVGQLRDRCRGLTTARRQITQDTKRKSASLESMRIDTLDVNARSFKSLKLNFLYFEPLNAGLYLLRAVVSC